MNAKIPTVAYLTDGRVRIKTGTSASRTIESPYGISIREKAVRVQQRHSWKSGDNSGSPFAGPSLWGRSAAPQDVPLAVTSICAGRAKGQMIYSLESGSLCALLESDQLGAEEKRVWNDNRTRLRHLSVSPVTGHLACSILHENGTANIGVKIQDESGVRELTEGDSFDTAPQWINDDQHKIVFQSAGIGRNREGHFVELGPFGIQSLDTNTGEMNVILEDPRNDYLAPRYQPNGSLFYIRRPYAPRGNTNFLGLLKDCVLFPFRLIVAVFHFLNLVAALLTGKQLTSAHAADTKRMNMRQMMIWGNLVHAQQRKRPEEEGVDLVPPSWELHERAPTGEDKIRARGVLAYDIDADGEIVYTNGSALFLLRADGKKERLLNEAMIEQVFFLPA